MLWSRLTVLWAMGMLAGCAGEVDGGPVTSSPDMEADSAMEADAAPDQGIDPAQAACRLRCAALEACGALKAEADCAALCEALADNAAYGEACAACGAGVCDAQATCLADPDTACGPTPVQLTLVLSGVAPGAAVQGRLRMWSGQPTPAFGAVVATEGGAALVGYDKAIHAGIRYVAEYFIDINGDGVCEPGVDETGSKEVFADGDTVVVLQYHEHTPGPGSICDGFASRAALCEQRCEAAGLCMEEEAGAGCQSGCEADPVAATVACLECMEGRGCAEQRGRCRVPGGVCRRDFVPPDASLISGANALFPERAGTAVVGIVRHMSGRILATAEPVDVREDGGFLLRYGMSVWRGQTYTVAFFLDLDRDGVCDVGEPARTLSATVGADTALLYQMFTAEQVTETDCEAFKP